MMKAGLQGTIWLALICPGRAHPGPGPHSPLSADIKKPAPLLLPGRAVPGSEKSGLWTQQKESTLQEHLIAIALMMNNHTLKDPSAICAPSQDSENVPRCEDDGSVSGTLTRMGHASFLPTGDPATSDPRQSTTSCFPLIKNPTPVPFS